jgi:hypothetical protein
VILAALQKSVLPPSTGRGVIASDAKSLKPENGESRSNIFTNSLEVSVSEYQSHFTKINTVTFITSPSCNEMWNIFAVRSIIIIVPAFTL